MRAAINANALVIGCLLIAASTFASVVRADIVGDGMKGIGNIQETLAKAYKEFEKELENANENMLTDLAAKDFSELNETARQLDDVYFSKDIDVPMDPEELSPELKRILLSGGKPHNVISKMSKFLPSEIQSPTYRPIKKLDFYKRYSFGSSCRFTLKIFGDAPTGDQLFKLSCSKPRLSQSFCYRIPIDVPVGALEFDVTLPFCLPDLSGFEDILRILNGDLSAALELFF
mmetsp:Transcript_11229/g.21100  ORF Transcript_11229/g.21100 Transcript_11229/m.21100 type:complete len:231 (-) Transcript_11229:89-781(-)|eukprot:CAMPEP_0197475306 /NCGR_PEP_ID=MMETSP1309-20131121/6775_1 /TAXON_ID=464262 /ORGANISM="Genus nov. species nov., Strain RCC998" /LENGTH=230 /DNA_ID=CAMNT_0043015301 /DNA_START=304 /DNA_END=996 /DNA_ORIENTATION=+